MPETVSPLAEELPLATPEQLPAAAAAAVCEALAAIGQDSVRNAAEYLADTVVPHGGE